MFTFATGKNTLIVFFRQGKATPSLVSYQHTFEDDAKNIRTF